MWIRMIFDRLPIYFYFSDDAQRTIAPLQLYYSSYNSYKETDTL